MCKDCDCRGCMGCAWICHCDYRCFKCRESYETYCGYCGIRYVPRHEILRRKFICFDCELMWKNKYTKYTYDDKILGTERIVAKLLDNRSSKGHCPKCGKEGQEVGRNFRPCCSSKEWKKLKLKVEKGDIDLIETLTYYPRETNGNVHTLEEMKKVEATPLFRDLEEEIEIAKKGRRIRNR